MAIRKTFWLRENVLSLLDLMVWPDFQNSYFCGLHLAIYISIEITYCDVMIGLTQGGCGARNGRQLAVEAPTEESGGRSLPFPAHNLDSTHFQNVPVPRVWSSTRQS